MEGTRKQPHIPHSSRNQQIPQTATEGTRKQPHIPHSNHCQQICPRKQPRKQSQKVLLKVPVDPMSWGVKRLPMRRQSDAASNGSQRVVDKAVSLRMALAAL